MRKHNKVLHHTDITRTPFCQQLDKNTLKRQVVFGDRFNYIEMYDLLSLTAVVSQDRFHCISMVSEYMLELVALTTVVIVRYVHESWMMNMYLKDDYSLIGLFQ